MRHSTPTLLILLTLPACLQAEEEDGRHPIPKDQRPPLNEDDLTDTGGGATDSGGADEGGTDGGGTTEGGSTGGGSTGGGGDVDQAEACHPDVEGWPSAWATLEEQVLTLVNAERAKGADCGSYGNFAKAGPLKMEDNLRCAARYHSLWMAQTDTFSHESPGGDLGDDPWERIASTDFAGFAVGENIAAGYGSAQQVMDGWMASDGHCSNIMNGSATLIGVGLYEGGSYGTWWTQDFGS